MTKRVYVDLGANVGDTLQPEVAKQTFTHVWGFEPNPPLAAHLKKRFAEDVNIVEAAAWIEDGNVDLYLGHVLSSTIIAGKKHLEKFPEFAIDYTRKVEVRSVNFSRWLEEHAAGADLVVIKMDIEGAEYAVLDQMISTGAIDLVDELRCEFHADRFPGAGQHDDRIRRDVAALTNLVVWK